MKDKLLGLYYSAYRGCRNFWRFFRYDLHRGIANLVRWFPIIWKDRDWDHAYLLRIMEKKMGQMSRLQSHYGNGLYRDRYARQLLVASRICKRLREDEYDTMAEKRYPRPEGWKIWTEQVADSDVHQVKVTPDPLFKFRIELAKTVQQRDKEMLGRLIGKYIDHWWD